MEEKEEEVKRSLKLRSTFFFFILYAVFWK